MSDAKKMFKDSYNKNIHSLREVRDSLIKRLERLPDILDVSMAQSDYSDIDSEALNEFLKYDGWCRSIDAVVTLADSICKNIAKEDDISLKTGAVMIEHITRWAEGVLEESRNDPESWVKSTAFEHKFVSHALD